jgi:putative membrane protein
MNLLRAIAPWEWSPTTFAATALALAVYLRGWYRLGARAGVLRPIAFVCGVLLPYAFIDTRLEYFALHLFWLQRIEHLVLHHLAPFLIALSAPGAPLEQGSPRWLLRYVWRPLAANGPMRALYRALQQPVVASVLFVGLIYFWLMPSVQLDTMLSRTDYQLMNASMLIDGLLFWWLMVGPEDPRRAAHLAPVTRMIILVLITVPQTALGAYIAFHRSVLYPSFEICGRLAALSGLTDQQLGGLNIWVPAGMMSALGLAVVIARTMAGAAPLSVSRPSAASAGTGGAPPATGPAAPPRAAAAAGSGTA